MNRDSREELCKIALAVSELGLSSPEYIAHRLRLPLHRVRSALSLMESFGWVEQLEMDKSKCPCTRCPLRRICPLPRQASRIRVYRVRREVLEYCRRLLSDNK